MRDERGFALLAVMLVLTLLVVVVIELAVSMRLEAAMTHSFKEGILAQHLAEAGVQQAIREILSNATIQALDETGQLAFYRAVAGSPLPPKRLPALRRTRVPFGAGEFSYRITDEEARVNLNSAPAARVEELLRTLRVEKHSRDVILDALQDWKDADDLHRANGAESDDYYLKLPVPYRARNAPLQDVAELLQIRGVSRALYLGDSERPGLGALVTVFGRNAVNINTAPAPVLGAIGLSDAEVAGIVQDRARSPYTVVPARYGARGLVTGSATFRIEAEGRILGSPPSRVLAIVQRGGRTGPIGVTVRLWRPETD
jgi:general secretion pathway protein K